MKENTGGSEARPLEGLRVVDASDHLSGQACSRLMAIYGADVVLVEPPDGSLVRRIAPTLATHGGEVSLMFEHLNGGKRSVVLDRDDERGERLFSSLLDQCDVVLLGSYDRSWTEGRPGLIACVVSDFPERGAYSQWLGSEMIHQALSGAMYTTGDPDRFPLYGLGQRAYHTCGVTAFITVLAALFEKERSGRGQSVSANVFESCAATAQNLVTMFSYNGSWPTRRKYEGLLNILECADGAVVAYASKWPGACRAFVTPELVEDERYTNPATRDWRSVWEIFGERAKTLACDDIVEAGQVERMPVEKFTTVDELIRHGDAGIAVVDAPNGLRGVGFAPPFVFRDAHNAARYCPAPAPGEHSEEILAELSAHRDLPIVDVKPPWQEADSSPGQDGPLKGLRVVDLTTAWAGPMATRCLAYLGAEVIKVEAPVNVDSWRGMTMRGALDLFPDREPGPHWYNRIAMFNTQNHDKLAFALDLTNERARSIVLELVAMSDLVIANFSPGVLGRIGLSRENLRAANPSIAVVEMPAFTSSSRRASHAGIGHTMEAASGMGSLMGYEGGPPQLTGSFYLDPIGGLHGAAASLLAILQARRTTSDVAVEVGQVEAAIHWLGEYILAAANDLPPVGQNGNALPHAAPHGAFPALGEDEWIVVAVSAEEQWLALCGLIGRPELAEDRRLANAAGRNRHESAVSEALSTWSSKLPKEHSAALLQGAGVPAAPVHTGRDVAGDRVLEAEGFFHLLDHPEAGRHLYPGLAHRLERTPGGMKRAAPPFGADTDYILGELLGMSPDDIADLIAEKVVWLDPVMPG